MMDAPWAARGDVLMQRETTGRLLGPQREKPRMTGSAGGTPGREFEFDGRGRIFAAGPKPSLPSCKTTRKSQSRGPRSRDRLLDAHLSSTERRARARSGIERPWVAPQCDGPAILSGTTPELERSGKEMTVASQGRVAA